MNARTKVQKLHGHILGNVDPADIGLEFAQAINAARSALINREYSDADFAETHQALAEQYQRLNNDGRTLAEIRQK